MTWAGPDWATLHDLSAIFCKYFIDYHQISKENIFMSANLSVFVIFKVVSEMFLFEIAIGVQFYTHWEIVAAL